jgi:hypothetical protein
MCLFWAAQAVDGHPERRDLMAIEIVGFFGRMPERRDLFDERRD